MKGKVWYLDKEMSVYRVDNETSWTEKSNNTKTKEMIFKSYKTEVLMLKGFQKDFPQYEESFCRQSHKLVMWIAPFEAFDKESYIKHRIFFREEILEFKWWEKLKFHAMKSNSIYARVIRKIPLMKKILFN